MPNFGISIKLEDYGYDCQMRKTPTRVKNEVEWIKAIIADLMAFNTEKNPYRMIGFQRHQHEKTDTIQLGTPTKITELQAPDSGQRHKEC